MILVPFFLFILAQGDYERVYRRGISRDAVKYADERAQRAAERAKAAHDLFDLEHGLS